MADSIVLVVDDEPHIVRLCQRVLEKAGFQVLTATSASHALTVLARQTVDALLVDIRMPGLDGFQLLGLAHHHQPEMAAVVMTGFGTVETAVTALRQGADGLILKPFMGAELVQTVQQALKESEHRREVSRLRILRPLLKITELLFQETDPVRLKSRIVEAVATSLPCSFSGLYLVEKTEGILRQESFWGEALENRFCEQDFREYWEGMRNGVPLWVNRDGPGVTRFQKLLECHGLRSLMCVDVPGDDGLHLMVAARLAQEPAFSAADLEMFGILAHQSGLALENARLYVELREKMQQLERSRMAMNRAEKMAAAGRLTALIAHELNNPLQSLHNCLHLSGRDELSTDQRQMYLGAAQNELERLMKTVQRMLDFYRPGARDKQLVNLNELITKVITLVIPQLQGSHIEVELDLTPELPMVMVVASQIQEVLLNLILNSMEAMPGGGEISIKTGRDSSSRGVEILVSDTGPGIPEEESELIFEPLLSTKEHGTGMGLAVSYGIIAAHGGALSLIKRGGKGACFQITLPEENVNESENHGG